MKSMIWHPEENDTRVNQYLEHVNHAPYEIIIAWMAVSFCLFTVVFLMGLY